LKQDKNLEAKREEQNLVWFELKIMERNEIKGAQSSTEP